MMKILRISLLVLIFGFVSNNAYAELDCPIQSDGYNITDYGAKGDGEFLNTKSIQKAIDACVANGGGKVIIPSGIFKSGSILLKSNVELHFEHNSVLLSSINVTDFPLQPMPIYRSHKDQLGGFNALIYAEGQENIALTGSGTIDGQGPLHTPMPNPYAGDVDGRPRNILLISCKNIKIDGLRMLNASIWNQHYLDCEDLFISNIYVYSHGSRNNDGIDIDGCRRVVLSNSIIDSDDDGIVLKSTGAAACEDIAITNCVVSSFCNAIKAGTETTGGFKNVSISNCVIKPSKEKGKPIWDTPRIGVSGLSLMIVDGGTLVGFTVNNLTIHGTESPIYIRLGNRARPHTPGAVVNNIGEVKNISISNVVAYNAGTWGSSITGLEGHPIKNISLNNIQLFSKGGLKMGDFSTTVEEDEKGYPHAITYGNLPSHTLYVRHAENISLNNVTIGTESPDSRFPIIVDDVDGLQVRNIVWKNADGTKPLVKGKGIRNHAVEAPLGWTDGDYFDLMDK
ncbi:glycoside hydrolase family 28 protein [Zobellia nedashkovskayae]|uniref:glycoside hydrolase family 28 protein n=1 Tax=Zobellia nedashkovskayae TaxID=2779510 RepID=UPI00188CB798|nr:glycosyl hydrolase family 28 protein [Zobellia nedashkovskayae]